MTFDRKAYCREYARKSRLAKWAATAVMRSVCPRKINRWGKCGTKLQNRLVLGVTVPFCPTCDLRNRGICIECKKAPVTGTIGRATWCSVCRKLRFNERAYTWRRRNRQAVARMGRLRHERQRSQPGYAERRRALQRLRALKRKRPNWNKTENGKAYLKAYRLRPEVKQAAKIRNHRVHLGHTVTHPCVSCGSGITGRAKKCEGCRACHFVEDRRIAFGKVA